MRQVVEGIYIVRAGESLSLIVRRELGAVQRYAEIAAINPHIRNPNQIYEGDFLFLPPRSNRICFDPMPVTSEAVADLKEASVHFKQMRHSHREALMNHGESVSLVAGVMAQIDGHQAVEDVLAGAHSVLEVAEQVQRNIRDVGQVFLHDLKMLKGAYPQVKVTDEIVAHELFAIQSRADATLQTLVGQTFRSKLSSGEYNMRALLDYVKGAGRRPTRFAIALKNTEKWLGRMETGGKVIVGLDFLLAGIECIHDVENGVDDLRKCAKGLGGFVGGTLATTLGGMLIAGLGLGGLPLIGAAVLLAGVGIGGSKLTSGASSWIYSTVNGATP